jgi:hypothetical protein
VGSHITLIKKINGCCGFLKDNRNNASLIFVGKNSSSYLSPIQHGVHRAAVRFSISEAISNRQRPPNAERRTQEHVH